MKFLLDLPLSNYISYNDEKFLSVPHDNSVLEVWLVNQQWDF